MFRANRIGTPNIMADGVTVSAAAIGVNNGAPIQEPRGNVINAVPQLDYGANYVRWASTGGSVPIGERIMLVQQFTVTPPIAGDTVGVETIAALMLVGSPSLMVAPILFKATAAAVAFHGNVSGVAQGLTYLSEGRQNISGLTHYCKEQTILRGSVNPVSGTYCHGFEIFNPTAGLVTFTAYVASMAVRQLNDQQDVGYRDTRR